MKPKAMSDCLDEIFKTVKKKKNMAWKIKKHRFYAGILSEKAKKEILQENLYVEVAESTYQKVKK